MKMRKLNRTSINAVLSSLLVYSISYSTVFAQIISTAAEEESLEQISWRRSFDDQDRLAKLIDPAGRETRFEYSAGPNGSLRVTKTPPEGGEVVWKYDDQGRLRSMTDGAGAVVYEYDDLGRLNSIQRGGKPSIRYTFDTQDRITSLRVGDFYSLHYTYDFLNRLAAMKTPVGTITYEYQTGQGLVIRSLPNGVKTIGEYGTNGQLRKITHANAENTILAEYAYEYRPDGLISAIGERSSRGQIVTAYEYDKVGRLIRAADQSGRGYNYAYDQVGNRLRAVTPGGSQHICVYDWAGRLLSLNGKPVTHDAVGNLGSMPVGEAMMTYRYNPDGQLSDAGSKVSYEYDGDNRLVMRQAGASGTSFIPDPLSEYWQPLVLDSDTDGRTLLVWDRSAPLIMIHDGKPEYMLQDHLGSVRLVIDGQGNVREHIDYDPFGAIQYPASAVSFVPRFASLFWDAEAAVYLTLGRAYSSTLGRFLGPDTQLCMPSESKQDHSMFTYCAGDPVNFFDRNGAEAEWADLGWYWELLKSFGSDTKRKILWISDPPDWLRNKIYNLRPPIDMDQRTDHSGEAKGWFIKTLNAYQKAALQEKYPGRDWISLSRDQKVKVRKIAVDRFATNHSDYPGHYIRVGRSKEYYDDFSRHVANMSIKTSDGLMSLDWFTTVIASKKTYPFLPSETSKRYAFEKTFHNTISPWVGQKRWPERGNEYPANNWTAVRFIDKVYDPDQSFERLFFVPKGIMGASVFAYSIPLRAEEYKTWKRSKPRRDPTRPSSSEVLGKSFDNYGGGWGPPGGPPGDPGGLGGPDGLGDSWSLGRFSPLSSRLSPSNVGGVYLGGAGQALDGIGQIEGFTLDANNNLILLSRTGREIDLLPLRLDDLVTVFRSVYIYGEGPTITIDPNPENPSGSAMIIRHGEATESTYVGWILYQADRLMKSYMLGVDNISSENMASSVPGYDEVVDAIYFGDSVPKTSCHEGRWERFWIVPASVHRFTASGSDLTLFDVPLRVKTQVMKWQNGELVDNPDCESSLGAMKFTDWFTEQYNLIAEEQYLTPPPDFGITQSVPVFLELRRIALMTALAEKLRDHGTPIPFWMRDYNVRLVFFERFTPGMQVTRSNGNFKAQIYGGVSLSPESSNVKQFATVPDLNQLPESERLRGEQILNRANALSAAVYESVKQTEPLKLYKIDVDSASYHAALMPGHETRALAPCRLEEVDMVVPIEGGRFIQLSRNYHSFFTPWDRGAGLDNESPPA